MSSSKLKNRHGLSRYIPADVSRTVRQHDGFGCVICAEAFTEYEHYSPEYKDAVMHDSSGICLLCERCHGKITRSWHSRESLLTAINDPKARRLGYISGDIEVSAALFEFHVGTVVARNLQDAIVLLDEPVISVRPPADPGQPFRVNATIRSKSGNPALVIKDNLWKAYVDSWDVQCIGPNVIIRSSPGEICLHMSVLPPNQVHIRRLNMTHQGVHLEVTQAGSVRLDWPESGIRNVTLNAISGTSPILIKIGCRTDRRPGVIAFANNYFSMARLHNYQYDAESQRY